MISIEEEKALELELDNLNPIARDNTRNELDELVRNGRIVCDRESLIHNMHCHTFFSYNGYGYSPSHVAWLARKRGWFSAGIIDFDVLDAIDEFKLAAEFFNVRYACGMESRVYVPELADKEINSPGEVGVAYHLGLGFTSGNVPKSEQKFADRLREQANLRTRKIVELVNSELSPLELDFDLDITKLTPNGNVTERHVCQAYRELAEVKISNFDERVKFWSEKLHKNIEQATALCENPVKLEGEIRSKTMKMGGVGYIAPTPESFPLLEEMNNFTINCGAIPAIAWLNGCSLGEANPDELIAMHIKNGVAMFNFVPDRNWNVADKAKQELLVANMNKVIESCKKFDLPVLVGTEMNAPGLKLVDDFNSFALKEHTELFVDGAAILFAHTLLSELGYGYLSDWAKRSFATVAKKNEFFAKFGRAMTPKKFRELNLSPTPEELLIKAGI